MHCDERPMLDITAYLQTERLSPEIIEAHDSALPQDFEISCASAYGEKIVARMRGKLMEMTYNFEGDTPLVNLRIWLEPME